jgi:hypothetical protein
MLACRTVLLEKASRPAIFLRGSTFVCGMTGIFWKIHSFCPAIYKGGDI